MDSISQLTEFEFETVLSDKIVLPFQVIQAALMTGATMFALGIIVTYFGAPSSEFPDRELVNALSIVHVFFSITAFGLSRTISDRFFSDRNLANTIRLSGSPYMDAVSLLRASMIVRMAILEGSAFFGLVVTLIAVVNGVAGQEPMYMLNMASYVVFMTVGVLTFPSKDKLMDRVRKNILKRF